MRSNSLRVARDEVGRQLKVDRVRRRRVQLDVARQGPLCSVCRLRSVWSGPALRKYACSRLTQVEREIFLVFRPVSEHDFGRLTDILDGNSRGQGLVPTRLARQADAVSSPLDASATFPFAKRRLTTRRCSAARRSRSRRLAGRGTEGGNRSWSRHSHRRQRHCRELPTKRHQVCYRSAMPVPLSAKLKYVPLMLTRAGGGRRGERDERERASENRAGVGKHASRESKSLELVRERESTVSLGRPGVQALMRRRGEGEEKKLRDHSGQGAFGVRSAEQTNATSRTRTQVTNSYHRGERR